MAVNVTKADLQLETFASRADAAEAASEMILSKLNSAIASKNKATLLVSGGSTPGPVFDRLSSSELNWSAVTVGLVDERWVGPEHEASNEKLVRSRLLRQAAASAGFLPMWMPNVTLTEAAADRSAAYRPHCSDLDVVLLGMGQDAHTASWFPNSKGLHQALEKSNVHPVVAIDATGCPVAGEHVVRLTLSCTGLSSAKSGVLLISGADKRDVLEEAIAGPDESFPIKAAIDAMGPRLRILWAP